MSKAKPIVLVIDDQPGIRRLLLEVLTEAGYEVMTAANGYEGLQRTKEQKPSLILMDMKMPGMDGLETLKEINKLGQSNKVIMMTAYGELDMVKEAQEIGAFAYITKPFDINELCELIAKHLSETADTRQLKIG